MPGMVMMLEQDLQAALDDLAEASAPPALLVEALKSIAAAPEVREWLVKSGTYLARRAYADIKAMIVPGEKPTPPNPWIEGLLMPFLRPIEEGAAAEMRRKVRPWTYGLAVLTGGLGLGLGLLVAGRKHRLVERTRREHSVAGR
jgi:hypothetical protein